MICDSLKSPNLASQAEYKRAIHSKRNVSDIDSVITQLKHPPKWGSVDSGSALPSFLQFPVDSSSAAPAPLEHD